jgi:hypothetical protein
MQLVFGRFQTAVSTCTAFLIAVAIGAFQHSAICPVGGLVTGSVVTELQAHVVFVYKAFTNNEGLGCAA